MGDESADVDTENDDDESDDEKGRQHTDNHRIAALGGELGRVGDGSGRHGDGWWPGRPAMLTEDCCRRFALMFDIVVEVNAVVDADQVTERLQHCDVATLRAGKQAKIVEKKVQGKGGGVYGGRDPEPIYKTWQAEEEK